MRHSITGTDLETEASPSPRRSSVVVRFVRRGRLGAFVYEGRGEDGHRFSADSPREMAALAGAHYAPAPVLLARIGDADGAAAEQAAALVGVTTS